MLDAVEVVWQRMHDARIALLVEVEAVAAGTSVAAAARIDSGDAAHPP